jgi:hypothetical protein
MGRTSTGARTDYFHYCPFQLSFSWGSNPARVKASKRGAKLYPQRLLSIQKLKIFHVLQQVLILRLLG